MKPTTLYLIRHARSDASVRDEERRPLTEEGREAARRLAAELSALPFSAVYSSPYRRTVETVQGLAAAKGLPLLLDDRLCERRVGSWVEDFRAFARRQWEDFAYKLEGGECLHDVQQRNLEALADIRCRHCGETVAVGTHGTALSAVLHHYDPGYGYEGFCRMADRMPYVLRLEFEGDALLRMEETERLSG